MKSVRKKGVLMLVLLFTMSIFLAACNSGETTDSGNSGNTGGSGNDGTASSSNKDAPNNNEQKIVEIEMVTFKPPSLGAFLTPIIENQEIDKANGIDIKFVERAPSAYNSEFASGQYKVGGSAALLSEGLRMDRGVKVSYLFNVFDYWGTVVSADDSIQTVKDLVGKDMAAAKSTTNYAMFLYFAKKAGVDTSKLKVLNAAPPTLITYAEADRADAVQLWQPAYQVLTNNNPGEFHQVDFGLDKWEEYTGTKNKPYLGIAAHQSWVNEHKQLVPKLYKTYKDAAKWVHDNPQKAAEMIAKTIPGGKAKVIKQLIDDNSLLGLNIKPAAQLKEDINAVFEAGLESGYLENMPDDSVIYQEPLE